IRSGDDGKAMPDLAKAISLDPKYAAAYATRGDLRGRVNDFNGALSDFDQALTLIPGNASLLNDRCWLRATANRELPLALDDCTRAVAAAPASAAIQDSLGFVYFRMGDLDKAIAAYNAALAKAPKLASSLFMRGVIELRKGQNDLGQTDIS